MGIGVGGWVGSKDMYNGENGGDENVTVGICAAVRRQMSRMTSQRQACY